MAIDAVIHLIPFEDVCYLEPLNLRGSLKPGYFEESGSPSMSLYSEYQDSGKNKMPLISPHNFPSVSYLNLAETWYDRDVNDVFESLLSEWRGNSSPEVFFRSYVNTVLYTDLKYLAYLHPEESRKIEIFLWYIRISNVLSDPNIAGAVFLRLLQILHMWHNDSALALNLLQTFCAIVPVKELLLTGRVHPEYLRYILRNANRARFNIRQFLAENIGMNPVRVLPFCPVLESLLSGKTSNLEVFISHGFDREEYSISLRNDMYLRYLASIEDMRIFLPFQDVYDFRARRHYLTVETLYLLYQFVSRQNEDRTTDWIRSGLLLFRSIPNPLISWRELAYLMYESDASQSTVARIHTAYETHFFEIISENYEPRSLKHLSRCAIRTALRNNFQLPNGIRRLNLPENVQKYLRLHS